MSSMSAVSGVAAGAVFDRLAARYDREFTDSLIGRAQRSAVWKEALKIFQPGDAILELNCGTGEDALFFAGHGISVFACDASQQMIVQAEARLGRETPELPVVFCHVPTERIGELDLSQAFDGVFSNFSGLNCIEDLRPVAAVLARVVKQGDPLLLCFSTRICVVEIVYYALCGKWAKALRRCRGRSKAVLDGIPLQVYYPTLHQLRRAFAPYFRLRSCTGVGVTVPPSYLEPWVRRHPHWFRVLCGVETALSALPILRTTGDHMLLCFEKVTP